MWLQCLFFFMNLAVQPTVGHAAFRLDSSNNFYPLAACDALGTATAPRINDTQGVATPTLQPDLITQRNRLETSQETLPLAQENRTHERLGTLKTALRGPPPSVWSGTRKGSTAYGRYELGSPVAPNRNITLDYKHRGGNRQYVVDGERWHVPKGRDVSEIPLSDPLGDKMQAAAHDIGDRWHTGLLSDDYRAAISRAYSGKQFGKARVLEARAKGQYVESQLKLRFPDLQWNSRGVDVSGPNFGYEVLSGTQSNILRHGRRAGMTTEFFRMITF